MMLLRRLPSASILLLLRSSSAFTSTNKLVFAIAASSPHQQQPFTSFGTLPKPSSLFLHSSTTQTKMTATATEEDPYIWLEEVESDKSLEFAKSANGTSRPSILQLSVYILFNLMHQ